MNTHEHYFRLVPLGSLFGEVHLVIVINCCVKSLLSVSVLHVSKVANATADGSNSKGHEVLVWLHIQLEIQRSEHTGGLKARMSTLSGKSQWEPPCSWFHLLLGVLWLPPLGRWAGASRVPSSTPEDLSVALVEFSCLWNLKGHAHYKDVKYFAQSSTVLHTFSAVKSGEEVCITLLQNGNSSGMGFNDQLGVVFVFFQNRKPGLFSTCSLFISMSEHWFSLFFKSLREKES